MGGGAQCLLEAVPEWKGDRQFLDWTKAPFDGRGNWRKVIFSTVNVSVWSGKVYGFIVYAPPERGRC